VSAVLSLLFVAPRIAHAEPSTQDRVLAESLFREARTLVDAGKLKDACLKFAESQRLDPQLGTLLYLATCHAEEGKTATAWINFSEAATLAERTSQPKRAEIARARAEELEAKLSKLVVEVDSAVDSMVVTLDGEELKAASWGTAQPVDPGIHHIEASAPGYATYAAEVDSPVGPHTETHSIPPLEAVALEPSDQPDPDSVPDEADGGTQRIVGFVVGGVGIAAIGVGTFFGFQAKGQADEADEQHCEGQLCDAEGLQLHDDAQSSALISTVLFGVGAAAAVTGLVVVLTAPSSADGSGADLSAPSLWLAPSVGGLSLGGRW